MEFVYQKEPFIREGGFLFSVGDTCQMEGNTWVLASVGKDTIYKGWKIQSYSLRRIDDDEAGSQYKWRALSEMTRVQ